MNGWLLTLIWLLPLVLIGLAGWRHAGWLMLLAPLPALIAGIALPPGSGVTLPWLLLGTQLGVDATGRVFLLFSGLLWLLAALFAAGYQAEERHATRYRSLFLLAMAGNLGLIVAQDMVTFYLGFTVMGLAAYGLIAQRASQRARRAARRYLRWTIVGELVLFVAVVTLAAANDGALAFSALADKPPTGLAVLLLILGFGIKLALPGLHLWLPQAYATAPPAVVAVLSGAMINAGLLGWLRFLVPGSSGLFNWGVVLMVLGLAGILFGAAAALLQPHPRLVLGYSSISKMGLLAGAVGATLVWPAAAPTTVAAVVIYAAHHALVKAALFLGLGLLERGARQPLITAGLVVLALALAGAPLTSGALAKSALSGALPPQAHYLGYVLTASAFATTLVMARFLLLALPGRSAVALPAPRASLIAWLLLLAVIVAFPLLTDGAGALLSGAVPVALAALLAALVVLKDKRAPAWATALITRPPARHLTLEAARAVELFAGRTESLGRTAAALRDRGRGWVRARSGRWRTDKLAPGAGADPWPLAGVVWLGIASLLLGALIFGV